jgi:hypothetical protein
VGQISRFLRNVAGGGLSFWCPGCREAHTVWTGEGPQPRWAWNGDAERPVFSPSVLVRGAQTVRDAEGRWTGGWKLDAAGEPLQQVCHSFVGCNGAQPGQIVFLGDCTHELAGKVVDLPELPPYLSRDCSSG